MSLLAKRIAAGEFVVTAELDPPRGTDVAAVMRKVGLLEGWIDALNITDSPRASMRMSPIALAHMVGERYGMETVFHLTCRDRNIIGLQSELLGAAVLGIRNILALSGDAPPEAGQAPHHGVYEVDSLGLVRLATALNASRDDAGRKLNSPTSFYIGVGANPNAADLGREAERVLAKVELGAHFIQTQPVFEVEAFERLATRLAGVRVPLIAGMLVPRTPDQLSGVLAHVPGIHIPDWFFATVTAGGQAAGLKALSRLAAELRGVAAGIHIMPMGNPESVIELARAAGGTGDKATLPPQGWAGRTTGGGGFVTPAGRVSLRVGAESHIAVLKFGGTSVASAASRALVVRRICEARAAGWQVVAVVSAMGRNGAPYATDTLLDLVRRECPGAADEDFATAYVCGELLSAAVISALIRGAGTGAACLAGWQAGIVTNRQVSDASVTEVRPQKLLELLADGVVPVVAGSQGCSADGTITTLGRGGSDTTAAVLGVALAADLIEVYTDTPGILTADPCTVPSARVIDSLSHHACERFASLGARVIHAKAVRMAARRPDIPLIVRGLDHAGLGTRIGGTGWLPGSSAGRPVGVAQLETTNGRTGAGPVTLSPGVRGPGSARVSVVHDGGGAAEHFATYRDRLAAARIETHLWLCEEDCFSVWVTPERADDVVRLLHSAAFGLE